MDKKLILLGLGVGAIAFLALRGRGTQLAQLPYAPSSASSAEFPQVNVIPPGSLTNSTDPLLLVGLGYGLGQLSANQAQQQQFLSGEYESNLREGNAQDSPLDLDAFRLSGQEQNFVGRSSSGAPLFFDAANQAARKASNASFEQFASYEDPRVLASRGGGSRSSGRRGVPASFESPFALANARARSAGNASFEKALFSREIKGAKKR